MNIETIIQGNTDSLIKLTEAIILLQRCIEGSAVKPTAVVPVEPIIPPKAAQKKEPAVKADEPKVDYTTVKSLISTLALNYRAEIKDLNKKYDLPVFKDILIDQDDPLKGVKDTVKLANYYADLVALDKVGA